MQLKSVENSRGKLIVIYGPNNLGKSVQIKLLASKLISNGNTILAIKYPIYQLQPTGPVINSILRDPDYPDRNLPEFEFQKLFAQNRRDFQGVLENSLKFGVHIVAEDYTGTGLAWGMTKGVSLEDLIKINEGLLQPDLAILLDGERFKSAVEVGHKNEDVLDEVWLKNREINLFLAEKFGWQIINANHSIEDVHKNVVAVVKEVFNDQIVLKSLD
jgi:thymidylate kinase